MNITIGWLNVLWLFAALCRAEDVPALIEKADESEAQYRVVWRAEPAVRYELQQSKDLQDWKTVPGFPALATQLAQDHAFIGQEDRGFFRVLPVDEQAPTIVRSSPEDGGFAVGRAGTVAVQVEDSSGVDETSIRLTVGALGTFTVNDPELSFADGNIVFNDAGDMVLGEPGETVSVQLEIADVLGNAKDYDWAFELEIEPDVVPNLFVFGSAAAQVTGQQVSSSPTAILAQRQGGAFAKMNDDVDPWVLVGVEHDRLEVAYTGEVAPSIPADAYVCNLTPTTVDEVFYRRVVGIIDDPDNQRLTLLTVDVPLEEILIDGSISLSADSMLFELDERDVLLRALAFDREFSLPSIGIDWSGEVIPLGDGVTLSMDQLSLWIRPALAISAETRRASLRRFKAHLDGHLEVALAPRISFRLAGAGPQQHEIPIVDQKRLIFVGTVGVVPIWLELRFTLKEIIEYNLGVVGEFRLGIRRDQGFSLEADYVRDRMPRVTWNPSFDPVSHHVEPLTFQIEGSASVSWKLVPQIDLRVNSLAGVFLNTDPRIEMKGAASLGPQGLEAGWTLGAFADFNAGMSVVGVDQNLLPRLEPARIFGQEWCEVYPRTTVGTITFCTQPESVVARAGESVTLSVTASPFNMIRYQWHQNGVPIPGATGDELRLRNVSEHHTGDYFARAALGSWSANSDVATVSLAEETTSSPTRVSITIHSFAGTSWDGVATPVTITGVVNPGDDGRAAFAGSNGKQERGAPLFSGMVEQGATFYVCDEVRDFPSQPGGPFVNRTGASSFIAVSADGERHWANLSAGAWRISGGIVSDWEYQLRYSSGDGTSEHPGRLEIGTVPNSNFFSGQEITDYDVVFEP